jgi:hypothetical protein
MASFKVYSAVTCLILWQKYLYQQSRNKNEMKGGGKAPVIQIDASTTFPSGTDPWYHYIEVLSGYLPNK